MLRNRYTPSVKRKTVNMVKNGLTVAIAADDSGASRATVYRWLKLHEQENIRDGLAKRASTLQRRIAHLQAELAWTQAKMTAWE